MSKLQNFVHQKINNKWNKNATCVIQEIFGKHIFDKRLKSRIHREF